MQESTERRSACSAVILQAGAPSWVRGSARWLSLRMFSRIRIASKCRDWGFLLSSDASHFVRILVFVVIVAPDGLHLGDGAESGGSRGNPGGCDLNCQIRHLLVARPMLVAELRAVQDREWHAHIRIGVGADHQNVRFA